jgi:predicted nucleic acid-binding protein
VSRMIILDTGPLVAALDRRDYYHSWAKEQFFRHSPPFLTCEAVITEACFLLRKLAKGPETVLSLVKKNALEIRFQLQKELETIATLVGKYSDIPMSLADACLVRMAEAIPNATVMTLDQDFKLYRKKGSQPIQHLIPRERR